MQISQNGINFIKQWEGCELRAYVDIAGVATIGYGHTATVTLRDVREGRVISQETAEEIVKGDLKRFVDAVSLSTKTQINQNQFDAFVSLAFNIGVSAFLTSTTLRRFKAGDVEGAAKAMTWWNKVTQNGKLVVSRGLKRRRAAEKKLFLTPVIEDRIVENAPLARKAACYVQRFI